MKKYIFYLFIISLSFSNDTYTQVPPFQKVLYHTPHTNSPRQIIALPDSTYMLFNHYLINPGISNFIAFTKLDKYGNKLFQKDYPIYGEGPIWASSLGTILYLPKEDAFVLGSSRFNGSNLDFHLAKFNSYADTIWTRTYDSGARDGNASLCATLDGGFIMSGESALYGTRNVYIIKVDSLGNEEWTNNHETSDYLHTTHQISVDTVNGGGYIIGGKCFHKDTDDEYMGYGTLTKVDSAGNEVWKKVYENNYYDNCFSYILPYPEGGYISWGCGINKTPFIREQYYIERLDAQGNEIWRDLFPVFAIDHVRFLINNIKILADNSLLVVGAYQHNSLHGWIAKYDPDGNMIWRRIYNHFIGPELHLRSGSESFYDAAPTLDGGFIVSGHVKLYDSLYNYTTTEPWVLKLDSNGCLYPHNCPNDEILELNDSLVSVVTSIEELPTNEVRGFKVYPNPAQNSLYLQIANDVVADAPFQLAIYDLMGRLMMQQTIQQASQRIDTSQLPDGMYLYHIQKENTTIYKDKLLIVR